MSEQIPQVELRSLILQDLLSAMDLARLKQTSSEKLFLVYVCVT